MTRDAAEPGSRSGDFGTRRKLRMLRQIVGDLKPGGLAGNVEVALRAYTRVIIESAKRDPQFRGAIRSVYNR
jgi:hypothetical protein